MCEFNCGMVNAQVGVQGANPLGWGKDANPPGRSGLVPGMCPYPGLWAPMLWTEAALCSRMAGEGAGRGVKEGREDGAH